MKEFFYLDAHGRELGSLMAFSYRDTHSWLGREGVVYHSLTEFKPRKRRSRDRRWVPTCVVDPDFEDMSC